MAMSAGDKINVTPMIDVLLVLLIIFMVITPIESVGLDAATPRPPDQASAPEPDGIMVAVHETVVEIDQQMVSLDDLPQRFATLRRTRGNQVLFLRGDATLDFESVAHVIDLARGAGLTRVALVK